MDRSSNRVVAAALALTLTAGVVYSGPAQGSTAVAPMPRSALGADLGFSAHLHDPTSGLILARALVLDPLTGSFLQRDPNGYQDSVNQYAYGANDPINHRDPTGREDEPGAGVPMESSPLGSAASIDDYLADAGTDCTVGACFSEVDISQMECLRTLGFAVGGGFCAAQPQACVTLAAASACMSSGASEEDALVLGAAMTPEIVAGLRAGQSLLKARHAERLAGIVRDPVTGEVLSITPPRSQLGMININLFKRKALPGAKAPSAAPQAPAPVKNPFGRAEPDVSIEKQLAGSGQIAALRRNPNLVGVDADEVLRMTPRQAKERLTKAQFKTLMKHFEGRDLRHGK